MCLLEWQGGGKGKEGEGEGDPRLIVLIGIYVCNMHFALHVY